MPLTSTDGLRLSVTGEPENCTKISSSRRSKRSRKPSFPGQDVWRDFKVLQVDGGGDQSDSEECSENEISAEEVSKETEKEEDRVEVEDKHGKKMEIGNMWARSSHASLNCLH